MRPLQAALACLLAMSVMSAGITNAETRSNLQTVPRPDLSAFEDAVRNRLENLEQQVDTLQESGSDSELANAYGALGMHYLAHTLRDASAASFANASALAPGDARWLFFHAYVLWKIGDHEASRSTYEHALEVKPDDVPGWLNYGDLLIELSDYVAAEHAYETALELSPGEAAAHSGLAKVANAQGNGELAVEHFLAALETQPQATSLHYQLALVYRKLGNMPKAREHLALRGEEPVRFVDPLLNQIGPLQRGDIFDLVVELAGKPDEINDREYASFALGHLSTIPGSANKLRATARKLEKEAQALDTNTEDAPALQRQQARLEYVLAAMLYAQQRYSESLAETENLLSLTPGMTEGQLLLGHIHEKLGHHEQAIQAYSDALAHEPESPEILQYRATALSRTGRQDEAATDLRRICELLPDTPEPRIRLAVAEAQLERYDDARTNYLLALELQPDARSAAQVQHHLATIATMRNNNDEALKRLHKALEADPGLLAAAHDLGALLGRLQRYDESADVFAAIVAEHPQDIQARLGEAVALHLAGREADALDRLEKGWLAIPESVDLLHALARQLAVVDDPQLRDGARAIELSRRTFRVGSTFDRRETLAMAYAADGQWDEAIQRQKKLIKSLPPDDPQRILLEANLKRYEQHLTAQASHR